MVKGMSTATQKGREGRGIPTVRRSDDVEESYTVSYPLDKVDPPRVLIRRQT